MNKKQRAAREQERLLGTFTLPAGQRAPGELTIDGSNTLLRVHADEFLQRVDDGESVTGVSYKGDSITLVDCRSPGTGSSGFTDGPTNYHADIFPHYITIGRQFLIPSDPCVRSIHFGAGDMETLFWDFDAFGHVIDSRSIIEAVLRQQPSARPIEAGRSPQVFYFTGKDCVAEVDTVIGKVSVHHRPKFNMGGPRGVYIKNRVELSLEFSQSVAFSLAIERMYDLCCFLSIAAGRTQSIRRIRITTTTLVNGIFQSLKVLPSFRWNSGSENEQLRPHPGDVPLDPIRRRKEFDSVLKHWVGRHYEWRFARGRLLGCMRQRNKYGPERLVAAANMFDILPKSSVPDEVELTAETASARDASVELFRKLPVAADRNSALSALGRLGQASLPKKVAYRTAIVESQIGARFADLQFVASIAVKCRNFYVHGSSGDLDFERVEPLVSFLTDTLEFIFVSSDFIEAGWDAARWNGEPKGWGHSFARYRSGYDIGLARLREATAARA